MNMIEDITNKVRETCAEQRKNTKGYCSWENHVKYVVKYSKMLAEKLNADIEIVELAALLHDYSGIKEDDFENHHLRGAEAAQLILQKYDYPQERLDKIKHCILSHSGRKGIRRESIEAEIVACADAMAHFENVDGLLYICYAKNNLSVEEGRRWVLDKLERSYNKLLPEAVELIDKKYEAIKVALDKEDIWII